MAGMLLFAAADSAVQNASIFSPASPPAQSIQNLSMLVLAISGFIFVVVEGVLFYSIYRFRRRQPDGRSDGTTEPPQVYGSAPIEIAWTAAPLLIVVVIVLVSARTLWEVNIDPPTPKPGDHALFVTVVGRQWWWEYTYDQFDGKPLGIVTANELHIPVSEDGNTATGFFDSEIGRRVSQLLGAAARGKNGLGAGPSEFDVVSMRPAGLVCRPMCRVLRHTTCQHAATRRRRIAAGVSAVAG